MAISRVLVTGASGFIGQHVVEGLSANNLQVRAAARQPIVFESSRVEGVAMGDMARSFAADYLVRGVDAVIHAAGMAHAGADIPEAAYTAINVDATRQLARAARAARVKRFILMSSIRAQVGPAHPDVVTEMTPCEPSDAYGRSKAKAEAVVAEVLAGSETTWTVLRPVLVYGPGVKGNMATLMRLASSPLPLPLGGLKGRRSLISIGNLVDAIGHVLISPAAENASFIVADDAAVSVADILRFYRRGLGPGRFLLPVPQSVIAGGLKLAGKSEFAERLTGDLVADAARLKATGWRPGETTADALERLARSSSRH